MPTPLGDPTSGRAVSPKIVLARAAAPRRSPSRAACARLGETDAGRGPYTRGTSVIERGNGATE